MEIETLTNILQNHQSFFQRIDPEFSFMGCICFIVFIIITDCHTNMRIKNGYKGLSPVQYRISDLKSRRSVMAYLRNTRVLLIQRA